MTRTLLLDLDDILLINDVDEFLPHYLRLFAKKVAGIVDPDLFVRSLLEGTQAMVDNLRPDKTLQEVFNHTFFSRVQVDEGTFRQVADRFYHEDFQQLSTMTKPAPGAQALIVQSVQQGDRIAVTTNPLFPRTAIEQRLSWAGLSHARFPFALITSYEYYHFTKPEPEFYAEVMARLGWPEGQVVAVGDDLERDISAARKLGLAAYLMTDRKKGELIDKYEPSASGNMAGLVDWLANAPEASLLPDYSSIRSMLAVMRSTPAALDGICRELSEEDWHTRPIPGEWNLTEICCHLRDVEIEVNQLRLKALLSSDNPFIAGRDTDRWAEERNYAAQDGKEALRRFIDCRQQLLNDLTSLSDKDWQRRARHAIFGPTHLAEIVNIICGHDRLHMQQVYNIFHPKN